MDEGIGLWNIASVIQLFSYGCILRNIICLSIMTRRISVQDKNAFCFYWLKKWIIIQDDADPMT